MEGVDLAAYAALVAQLAARHETRAAVLARARLDEARWLRIEQAWLLRLATAALQGDLSLGQEHDEAFAAARAAMAAERALPIEAYAQLVAAIESGREPAEVVAGAGLTLAAFFEHQRAWTARLAADQELAAAFRAKVAAVKG